MRPLFCLIFVFLTLNLFGQLPSNMYADSANAPFLWGVASGDPLPNNVVLWTKISAPVGGQAQQLTWEISVNNSFTSLANSGLITVDSSRDWTAHVEAGNLQAEKIYYFRFKDANGFYSSVGRTRTAPDTNSNNHHVRFTLSSCSIIYSGFFNAYRRISEKTDLDFVMHVGDYIYDFVDQNEEIRVPTPYPVVPNTRQEWRDRHAYYLLDPDLREARRMHPWVMVWDNHDINSANDPLLLESMKAFYDYNPIRLPNISDTSQIFRRYHYGNLVDILMTDILTRRNIDSLGPNAPNILGNVQYQWMKNELQNSTATWKLVGNQKMFSDWSVSGLPAWFPGNSQVLTTNTWDGFDVHRDDLLGFLDSNQIDNVLFLSGDAHVTLVADCSPDPNDGQVYNGNTGNGSVAAEFLPTSISRGNFDEMGLPPFLLGIANALSEGVNPHHVHSEFTKNGYGLIDVQPDTIIAEIWYSDILNLTNQENFQEGYMLRNGVNHWERNTLNVPSPPKDTVALSDSTMLSVVPLDKENRKGNIKIYPNPSSGIFNVEAKDYYSYVVFDIANGKTISEFGSRKTLFDKKKFNIDLSNHPNGSYLVKYFNAKGELKGFHQLIKH